MEYPCFYIGSTGCKYDGVVNTDEDTYQYKTVNGKRIYWHYRCKPFDTEIVALDKESLNDLRKYLRKMFEDYDTDNLPNFVKDILNE